MTRRALVTGGAGFIGTRLVRELLAHGWEVSVLDDFSVGHPDDLSFAGGAVQRFAADVASEGAVQGAMTASRPTTVFHLAGLHFIPHCDRDPMLTIRTNIVGTQRILDHLPREPACRLVFASTGDVYASTAQPHTESAPLAPGSLYGISKMTGEQLVGRAVARGSTCRIARLFNVYGPGDRTPHVLPDIVNSLTQHRRIDVGCLDPVRDYVYVDDVARALVMLAGYDGPEPVFNIGSGEGRSVRQLLDAVVKAHGASVPVRTSPDRLRPVDRAVLIADSRLAGRELGWSPQTAFHEGIARTVTAAASRFAAGDVSCRMGG